MEIHALLLDREGAGRELIAFSSKQSLPQSVTFWGGAFQSSSHLRAETCSPVCVVSTPPPTPLVDLSCKSVSYGRERRVSLVSCL